MQLLIHKYFTQILFIKKKMEHNLLVSRKSLSLKQTCISKVSRSCFPILLISYWTNQLVPHALSLASKKYQSNYQNNMSHILRRTHRINLLTIYLLYSSFNKMELVKIKWCINFYNTNTIAITSMYIVL